MPDPHRTPTLHARDADGQTHGHAEQSAHDELAELFFGGSAPRAAETARAGTATDTGKDDRAVSSSPDERSGDRFRVELLRTPRLGRREPELLRRYAAGVSARAGRPVLLILLGRHTVSAEAVRAVGPDDAAVGTPARSRSLGALLRGSRAGYGAVLIHDGGATEAAPASEPVVAGLGVDAVSVLFDGKHDGAAAWAWRSLREASRATGGRAELRAGDLTAEAEDRGGRPGARGVRGLLGEAPGGELDTDVREIEPLDAAFTRGLVYRGTISVRAETVIDAVRRAPDRGPKNRQPEREPGDGPSVSGGSMPAALRGVRPLPVRCPMAESIEVGIDGAGGVHLIGREACALAALLCAERWVMSRPSALLRCAPGAVCGSPELHLLTLDERAPALLEGTRVRAHTIRRCWPG